MRFPKEFDFCNLNGIVLSERRIDRNPAFQYWAPEDLGLPLVCSVAGSQRLGAHRMMLEPKGVSCMYIIL